MTPAPNPSPAGAPDPAAPTKPVIGLLGAPGSGKSFVAAQFAAMGAAVIDADAIARDVLDHPDVRRTLAAWWGDAVLQEDGRVDRAAVGRRVFDDPAELARLEALVHPRVNAERTRLRELHRGEKHVVAIIEDCPLLLERELDRDCDVLIFVDVPLEVRRRRVRETRGWSADELARREKNQAPLDIKCRRADYILDNHAEPSVVRTQARRLLDEILSKTT